MYHEELWDVWLGGLIIYLGIEIMIQIEWAVVHKREYARDFEKVQYATPVEIGRKLLKENDEEPVDANIVKVASIVTKIKYLCDIKNDYYDESKIPSNMCLKLNINFNFAAIISSLIMVFSF
jgi:hypothetical protein